MDNKINVIDEQGNSHEVEVLEIFGIEGSNKEYILYTNNREVDPENIEAYVSILKEENDNYLLLNIEDENEWSMVQEAIKEMGEANGSI